MQQDQVAGSFKEREIRKIPVPASLEEEKTFKTLGAMTFQKLDQHRGGSYLFRTTLEKALFSSPAACLQTIENRVQKLEKDHGKEYSQESEQGHPDIPALDELSQRVAAISPSVFTKFQKLARVLTDENNPLFWNGRETTDRLVIFTERVETLKFLKEHLPRALNCQGQKRGAGLAPGSIPLGASSCDGVAIG